MQRASLAHSIYKQWQLGLRSCTLPDLPHVAVLRCLSHHLRCCRYISADIASKMGGGAMVSGPSFDKERVAMYEGKTTAAGGC